LFEVEETSQVFDESEFPYLEETDDEEDDS